MRGCEVQELLSNRTHMKLIVSLIETSDTTVLELFVKETDGLKVLSSWLSETGRQGADNAAMKHVRRMLKTLMHLAGSCGAALYEKMKEASLGKTVKRLYTHPDEDIQRKARETIERLCQLVPTRDKSAARTPKETRAMPAAMGRHGSSNLSEDAGSANSRRVLSLNQEEGLATEVERQMFQRHGSANRNDCALLFWMDGP